MQVISNAIRIVECVIRNQPLGVTEISKKLGLPKTTVHRTLQALEDNEWLARQEQDPRKWVQTPRLWLLTSRGPGFDLTDLVSSPLSRLNRATDENVHVTQSEQGHIIVIEKRESTQPIRVYDPLGTKVPMHKSSSGKAMLSTWSDESLNDYFEQVQAEGGALHDEERSALLEELSEIRRRGYALNKGNWRPEISGIGTNLPLEGLGAPAPYGLAISIPTHRMQESIIPEFVELLLQARQDILDAAGITKERQNVGPSGPYEISQKDPQG